MAEKSSSTSFQVLQDLKADRNTFLFCCDNLEEFVLDISPVKASLIHTVFKMRPELF